jgi:hypothetical protein
VAESRGLSSEDVALLRGAVRRWRPDLEGLVAVAEAGMLTPDEAGELRSALMNEVSTDSATGDLDERGRAFDSLMDRLPWW